MTLWQNREVRAVAAMASILGAFAFPTLASDRFSLSEFAQLFSFYLSGAFALWLFLGLGWIIIALVRNFPRDGQKVSPFAIIARQCAERWERDRLISLFWPPLLFAGLISTYNAFKQMILVGQGFRYDSLFASLDRALFLGHDPWRVIHALLPGAQTAGMIDLLYHGWYAPMSLGVLVCAWFSPDSWRLRTQYLLTYLAIWIGMGSFVAAAFPAAGPVFVPLLIDPASPFAELTQTLKAMTPGVEIRALELQQGLLESYGSDHLAFGGGISALPSVHNALAILFALAAFRINRMFGWVMATYAFFIWISSVYLGWHYAIDGIISLLLTLPSWHYAGRFADWLESAPSLFQSQAPDPLPAA